MTDLLQIEKSAAGLEKSASSHSLVSMEDWSDYNQLMKAGKPDVPMGKINPDILEFTDPFGKCHQNQDPDNDYLNARDRYEDKTRYLKKLAEIKNQKWHDKPDTASSEEVGKPSLTEVKPGNIVDGGIKKYLPKSPAPKDCFEPAFDKAKPAAPADGGFKKPQPADDFLIEIGKPKPIMDGGIKKQR